MAIVENKSGEATPIYISEFAQKIRALMAQEVEPVKVESELQEQVLLLRKAIKTCHRDANGRLQFDWGAVKTAYDATTPLPKETK